jgi:large subunit ribosomal protein L15
MTITRQKKVKTYRGSKTHGCGSMKKRRGAGNRGGRGLAGSGKRAGHKVQQIWKRFGTGYLGKSGFKVQFTKRNIKEINLNHLELKLDMFMKKGFAKQDGDFVTVDLEKAGYNKLLGSGIIKNKFKIKVKYFSKKAKEKLDKIGGEIVSS